MSEASQNPVVIVGAGPAGLTAAHELSRAGVRSVVLEKSGVVGGISQTAEYKGYLFDIGGHRFFTKATQIQKMWEEAMGDDFLERSRLSRIYYNSHFFMYPLQPMNALQGLGLFEAARCGFSYLKSAVLPVPQSTPKGRPLLRMAMLQRRSFSSAPGPLRNQYRESITVLR